MKLYDSGEYSIGEIVELTNIKRSTFYQYLKTRNT